MLDRHAIERLAATTEGNALAHFRAIPQAQSLRSATSWTKHEMLAASGFAVAASYWALIDPVRAAVAYWMASLLYREMGHSYWMPLALASSRADGPAKITADAAEAKATKPTALAFAMIGDAVLPEQHASERLNSMWEHTGSVPVGRLGIPLGFYQRCAEAMGQRRPDRFRKEARSYLERMSEVMSVAAHNHFLWERMHSAVLPVEPEAVAMAAAMSRVAKERFGTSMLEMVENVDEHGLRVMRAGDELYRAAAAAADRLEEELTRAGALAIERRDPIHDDDIALRVARITQLLPDERPFERFESLIREYAQLVEQGSSRSPMQETVAAKMRALAMSVSDHLRDLSGGESSDRAGRNLAAVSILEVVPNREYLDWLGRHFGIGDWFIAKHAAWALVRAARDLPESAQARIAAVIHQALRDCHRFVGLDVRLTIKILQQALRELDRSEEVEKPAPARESGGTNDAVEPVSAAEVAAAMTLRNLAKTQADLEALRMQINALAAEYEKIRAEQKASPERTRTMEIVASKMRALSLAGYNFLPWLTTSPSPGHRLTAVSFLEMKANSAYLGWLEQRFAIEQPFIGYHAALALRQAVRELPMFDLPAVEAAIRKALDVVGLQSTHDDRAVILRAALDELRRRK